MDHMEALMTDQLKISSKKDTLNQLSSQSYRRLQPLRLISAPNEGDCGFLATDRKSAQCMPTQSPTIKARGTNRNAFIASSQASPRAGGFTEPRCLPQGVRVSRVSSPKNTYFDGCGVLVDEVHDSTAQVIARYKCGALLGSGISADVYEFTNIHTQQVFACKVIDREKLNRVEEERVYAEVRIHQNLRHANIVRLVAFFSDEHYHYLLLERCRTKNLMQVATERGVFSTKEMQRIFWQLNNAVGYMHEKGIIHRDIKLGNVLIDYDGNVKIGDFGFASALGPAIGACKTRVCGTPNYIAPEILQCKQSGVGYGMEVDIWSLGVLFFILAYGFPPFQCKDVPSTYERIRSGKYHFPHGSPTPCSRLIESMLQSDPQRRPSCAQVKEYILRWHMECMSSPVSVATSAQNELVPPVSPAGRSCTGNPQQATQSNKVSASKEQLVIARHACASGTYSTVATSASPLTAASAHGLSPTASNESPFTSCTDNSSHRARKMAAEYAKGKSCTSFGDNQISVVVAAPHVDRCCTEAAKPPPPPMFVIRATFFRRYRYGHLLVFNEDADSGAIANTRYTAFHCAELKTRRPVGKCVVPLMFYTDQHTFQKVGVPLAENCVVSDSERQRYQDPNLMMGEECSDACVYSTFRHSQVMDVSTLFVSASAVTNCTMSEGVSVKASVMERLSDLTGEFAEVNMVLTGLRLADDTFQLSIRCDSGCPVQLIPNTGVSVGVNTPWAFDLLVYSGYHVLFGFEADHVMCYQTVNNVRTNVKRTSTGCTFFAGGYTRGGSSKVTLNSELLRLVAHILQKLGCSSSIVDCFC